MRYGYARVSTEDQTTAGQIEALEAAGCDQIFSDNGISGSTTSRPELDELLQIIAEGDELVVWRLDRLGRSMQHVVTLVSELGERGVQFRSLTENLDTTTASGELIFHIFASLAHFERRLISERTKQGMKAAKCRGTHVGRPRSLSSDAVDQARKMIEAGETVSKVARTFKVSRATLHRALAS